MVAAELLSTGSSMTYSEAAVGVLSRALKVNTL